MVLSTFPKLFGALVNLRELSVEDVQYMTHELQYFKVPI